MNPSMQRLRAWFLKSLQIDKQSRNRCDALAETKCEG